MAKNLRYLRNVGKVVYLKIFLGFTYFAFH